jgi:hypothetical protein
MWLSWRKDAQVLRISAGLVMCVTAAVTVGCGTVPAPASGSGAHMAVPAKTANHGRQHGASTAGLATAGSSSGCQSRAPAGIRGPTARTLVITLAGNAKTYCVRVGDKLHVDLRGTASDPWLRPLVSGDALAPGPGAVTAGAVTSASFAAVQPGRVTMTSVRPPCQVAVPSGKNELEPAFPLPKVYPLKSCSPGHRFSALVIVSRLGAGVRRRDGVPPGAAARTRESAHQRIRAGIRPARIRLRKLAQPAREHAYLLVISLPRGTGWR